MPIPSLPIEGGCRCCAVRFRLTEAPWSEAACHCTGCQKMGGSAFATTLDDAGWFAPWMETQTAEKLAWAETGAARSFERFPEMSDYERIVAEYHAAHSIAG